MDGMQGRTCLVTGGSSGIGKETALGLARKGATVVIVSRDRERGAAAVADIQQRSGNNNISMMLADLSSQASIRQLADEYQASGRPLHVLLNNAGAVYAKRTLSPDGIEMTWALNHLAYFLLTNLLVPLITSSGTPERAARIVNVSSDAHQGGSIDFDDPQRAKRYFGFGVYAQSKLANLLFTYELARRLRGTPVKTNAVHPGFVASGFAHNNRGILSIIIRALSLFAKTVEQGAQTSIYVASAPELEGVTGRYFVDCKDTRSAPQSYDNAVAERLWRLSEEMTGMGS